MTAALHKSREDWSWRCLHCHGVLAPVAAGLNCSGCGNRYPTLAGIPILVREPTGYVRSELALLARTSHDARQRRSWLDRIGHNAGVSEASLDRHRDVLDAEVARAETFRGLLEPAAQALADEAGDSLAAQRSGWTLDALLPYLLRDWTDTSELEAMAARIGTALRQALPDPSGKSVVFAACGAGGLLAELPPEFKRVLGFDLTLPVLAAARHLLDGKSLDLALPRAINQAGHMTLRRRDGQSSGSPVELVAMDAFDTAFADGSVDCIVTAFLIDLIPEPRRLAHEIHRILATDGVWINYGPSGPLKAFLRFDQTETAAFLEAAGFTAIAAEAYRTTYIDLSRDCPTWSFQNHICYLTAARKAGEGREQPDVTAPDLAELSGIIPQHFPGANLVHRQTLTGQQTSTTILRHEGVPGRTISREIGSDAARIMALVDGKRSVHEIADLLNRETTPLPREDVIGAFAHYFEQGLLSWRDR
jgi:SAM-dependent methyltransferase